MQISSIARLMKIQIASDLHLELHRGHYPPIRDFYPVADRDVLVLAGDIGTGMKAAPFIEEQAAVSPVLFVPGNHEYYGGQSHECTDAAWYRFAARHDNLHYLIGEGVTINGVRFWGAPWYSDLFGRRDRGYLKRLENSLNDFDRKFNVDGRWTIQRHLDEHARQTKVLRAQAGEVDVVITHWPPTMDAIAPRLEGDDLNGYFVNDREDLVEEVGALLWISGHVHDPFDCVIAETRCVGNPAGFPGEASETRGFFPDRIIEI